jgi:hypothetical protein
MKDLKQSLRRCVSFFETKCHGRSKYDREKRKSKEIWDLLGSRFQQQQ